jgi:hypothetical protein
LGPGTAVSTYEEIIVGRHYGCKLKLVRFAASCGARNQGHRIPMVHLATLLSQDQKMSIEILMATAEFL